MLIQIKMRTSTLTSPELPKLIFHASANLFLFQFHPPSPSSVRDRRAQLLTSTPPCHKASPHRWLLVQQPQHKANQLIWV